MGGSIDGWLGVGEAKDKEPDVETLTAVFFFLFFLCATQDIAVDGWAITMLSKENTGWQATCNTVGQNLGIFLSYIGFMVLTNEDICNKHLRSVPAEGGILTLPGMVYFWGWVFLLTTVYVWLFKPEVEPGANLEDEEYMTVSEAFRIFKKVMLLPSVQSLVVVLLTFKVAFGTNDSTTDVKFVEYGFAKETIAFASPLIAIISFVAPMMASKLINDSRPMDKWCLLFIPRLLCGLCFTALVAWTPNAKGTDGNLSPTFLGSWLVVTCVWTAVQAIMFACQMAFFAKISDPAIGGTYMTLLNTIANLGNMWPATFSMWVLDPLTTRSCDGGSDNGACDSHTAKASCVSAGGKCITVSDGYFVLQIAAIVFGLVWLLLVRPRLKRLQDAPETEWRVTMNGAAEADPEEAIPALSKQK